MIVRTKAVPKLNKKSGLACTNCFSALGIKSRMDIYAFLKDRGQSTVTDIVDRIRLTQPTVSYHLKEMREAGLLDSRKVGKEVFYTLSNRCKVYDTVCVLCDVQFPI